MEINHDLGNNFHKYIYSSEVWKRFTEINDEVVGFLLEVTLIKNVFCLDS